MSGAQGAKVASGQYTGFNDGYKVSAYVSAKSFIEVTVRDDETANQTIYIYEYEPID